MKVSSKSILTGLLVCGAVTAVALCALSLQRAPKASMLVHDFGVVPTERSETVVFPIRNDSDRVMQLSGLEQACGVRAKLLGNPVVAPHGAIDLQLSVTIARRWGPGAAQFRLLKTVKGKTTADTFVLKWEVLGEPWLDVNQIWIDSGVASSTEVNLQGTAPDSTIRLIGAPKGITIEPGVEKFVVHWNPPSRLPAGSEEVPYGELSVAVKDGDISRSFSLPVFLEPSASQVLYPAALTLFSTEGTASLTDLGAADEKQTLVSSSPAVTVERHGTSIEIRRVPGVESPSQVVTVTALGPKGQVLGRSDVFLEARSW